MIEQDKEMLDIIKNVSQNIIKQIAPEEIDMFDEISYAYFNNPDLLSKKNQKIKYETTQKYA